MRRNTETFGLLAFFLLNELQLWIIVRYYDEVAVSFAKTQVSIQKHACLHLYVFFNNFSPVKDLKKQDPKPVVSTWWTLPEIKGFDRQVCIRHIWHNY